MRWTRPILAAFLGTASWLFAYWMGGSRGWLVLSGIMSTICAVFLFSDTAKSLYRSGFLLLWRLILAAPAKFYRIAHHRTFGLRAFLIIVAFVAIACGGLAKYMRSLEEQDRFIQMIERMGGTAAVSCRWPRWLRSAIGEDRIVGQLGVDFNGSRKVNDGDIARLAQDPVAQRIINLDVGNTSITNEGLRHVARLSGLTQLNASGCHIDDDGLAALQGSRELRCVQLLRTQVSVQGVRDLNQALPGDPSFVVSFEWRY